MGCDPVHLTKNICKQKKGLILPEPRGRSIGSKTLRGCKCILKILEKM